MNKKDKIGIASFLVITFAITYGIEFTLIANGISPIAHGFGQYIVALVMWVPAFAALITVKFITKEGVSILRMNFGKIKPYLISALVIPVCYLIIYSLTLMFGFGEPDWEMNSLKNVFIQQGQQIPEIPKYSWVLLYLTTLVFAPLLNSVFGFGEELGWRGYLLFKLLPLGKLKAYTLLGVIWGLWHLPMILVGFMYPGYPLLGIVFFCLLTTLLGIYMNELTIKYNSSVIAGWIHGLFNSQRLGIWTLLFPAVNPLLGGYGGIIGLAIWALLGFIILKQNKA